MVDVRVRQKHEVHLAGAHGQRLRDEHVPALLHAAVDEQPFARDLHHRHAARDLVRRPKNVTFILCILLVL